jgi:diadenylate cyclase
MQTFSGLGIGSIVEVLVLTAVFYFIFIFFRGTRSAQMMVGLILFMTIFIALTQVFHLAALNWLLRHLSVYLAIAVLIIFQPELRRALAELGKPAVFAQGSARESVVDSIVQAVEVLAKQRVGALIAIEQEIGTRAVQETGVTLDSRVTPELLASVFFPHTPLHDGGVIIRKNRMVAAGCVFPLTQRSEPARGVGTRHRAAMGLTEETDAVVVVVSEETGAISVSHGGRLSSDLRADQLRRFLGALVARESEVGSAWERAKEQLDLTPGGIAKSQAREGEEAIDAG